MLSMTTDEFRERLCEVRGIETPCKKCGGKERQCNRAKTFPGIAKAMVAQWGGNA